MSNWKQVETQTIMKVFKHGFALLLLLIAGMAYAQADAEGITSLEEGTVQEKFDFIKQKSGNYLDNKVVKLVDLNAMQQIVQDSLRAERAAISELRLARKVSQDSLAKVKKELKEVEEALVAVKEKSEKMSFLGAPVSKGAFSSIMWALVLLSLGGLIFVLYSGRENRDVVEKTKESLDRIQEEYDGFRKRALEREQKLKRDLIDAQNKG